MAQLTIFYAGMVNVYDHVPYEKVSYYSTSARLLASALFRSMVRISSHYLVLCIISYKISVVSLFFLVQAQAIMLLAGRESYPNYESLLGGCSATESPWICSPGAINLQASRGGSPAPLSSADLPPPGVVHMAIRPTPTTTAGMISAPV